KNTSPHAFSAVLRTGSPSIRAATSARSAGKPSAASAEARQIFLCVQMALLRGSHSAVRGQQKNRRGCAAVSLLFVDALLARLDEREQAGGVERIVFGKALGRHGEAAGILERRARADVLAREDGAHVRFGHVHGGVGVGPVQVL